MSGKRIIIIDDDARNIFALEATLRASGFICETFQDAIEAIKVLQKVTCDIILIDMMMPEMDGYEAIPKLRQITGLAHIPIIAVTAQAMAGDREKCIAAGANDYISKPIDVDRMLSVLNEQLTEH